MKKIISLLVLVVMVIGLTGCLDPQDGSNGRPQSAVALTIK
jgi:hypothetical protein